MPATGLSDAAGAAVLAARLRDVPRELRRELRPVLIGAGQRILADARQRASWSTRIPSALGLRVRFAGTRSGVYVTARQARAPHARAYEGISGRRVNTRVFRHPIFGHDRWVAQRTRPFLAPAAAAHRDESVSAIQGAVNDALIRAGFR